MIIGSNVSEGSGDCIGSGYGLAAGCGDCEEGGPTLASPSATH